MVFVMLALMRIALGSRWEAAFAAIVNIRAHSHRLGKPFGSHFYCYLYYSRSFASPWEAVGEPLLLLFVISALIRISSGSHFCCYIRAHSHRSGSHWEATFAAICSRSFASPWEAIGEPLLRLFVIFVLIRIALGSL
jgi:hypothetical protein